ncbi:hypothetical protein, partial [Azospirillum sp. SYSU D00513]|uniref:hypothetical protein n=1 Tax=Azospirillum sp. SYSU D00513 TaxID=2812561 RepID=UPI001A978F9F
MEVIDWSPDELGDRASFLPAMLSTRPYDPGDNLQQEEEMGFWEVAGAAFERENLAWNALKAVGRITETDSPGETNPNWNPYAYMRTTWDEEKYTDLLPYITQGLFEDAITPEMVENKAVAIEEERLLMKRAEGSLAGALTGGLAAAVADPTSYIPVGGWLMAGGRLMRIGKLALHGAATGALQEAGLHQFQDLRTVRESLMNIGTQTVLAGGFGTLGYGFGTGHPLNPANLGNPLRPENLTRQGVVTRVVGEGDDVLSHADDSIGAARVAGTEDFTGNAPGREGSPTALGRFATQWTPAGRALSYSSDTVRSVLVRLMDLGGVYTDTNRFGLRTAHSAEDLKRDYFAHASRLELGLERIIRETRQAMGDVGAARIDAPQFHEITRLMLKGMYEDTDRVALEATFGPRAVPIIEAKAQEAAEAIHKTNEVYEKRLVELGFLRDEAKVSALRTRIKALSETRQEAVEPLQQQVTQLRGELAKVERGRNANPTRAQEIKGQIADLQTRITSARSANRADALRAELQRQMSLPASMGRDYGHAQLWDRAAIAENPADFERFLFETLVSKPDEGWLMETHGLTAKELDDLKTVEPDRYREILQAWGGDEFYHRLNVAEAAFKAAEDAVKQTKLDLNETLRSLGMIRRGEKLAELSEARKFRDRFHTELAAKRAKRDQIRAEYEALTSAAEAARSQTLFRQLEPLTSNADVKALAATQEKARVLARDLRRADGAVSRLEKRAAEVEEAYRVSAEKLENLKTVRKTLQEARREGVSGISCSAGAVSVSGVHRLCEALAEHDG